MFSIPGLFRLPPIWRESLLGIEAMQLLVSDIFRHPEPARAELPILLIPGLFAGDTTLKLLENWLVRAGYSPHQAGMLSNINCSEAAVNKLEILLEQLYRQNGGKKLVIIGHSRGGQFARVLAVRRPELVCGIITLGSPLIEALKNTHPLLRLEIALIMRLGQLVGGSARGFSTPACFSGPCCHNFWTQTEGDFPIKVPFFSLYSRLDGVIRYQSCLDPHAKWIEVPSTHCGFAANAHSYQAISDALAQLAGAISAPKLKQQAA